MTYCPWQFLVSLWPWYQDSQESWGYSDTRLSWPGYAQIDEELKWAIVLCPMLINNDFGIPLVVLILIDVAKNRFPSSKPACRTLATVELSSRLPRRLQSSTPGWWWWWWWWWWKFLTKTILSFETRSLYSGCRRSRHTSWARWSGTLESRPEYRFSVNRSFHCQGDELF